MITCNKAYATHCKAVLCTISQVGMHATEQNCRAAANWHICNYAGPLKWDGLLPSESR